MEVSKTDNPLAQKTDIDIPTKYPLLRLADRGLLCVPFARIFAGQNRAFSVAGPLVWNSLPFALQSLPGIFFQVLLQQLKQYHSASLGALLSSPT